MAATSCASKLIHSRNFSLVLVNMGFTYAKIFTPHIGGNGVEGIREKALLSSTARTLSTTYTRGILARGSLRSLNSLPQFIRSTTTTVFWSSKRGLLSNQLHLRRGTSKSRNSSPRGPYWSAANAGCDERSKPIGRENKSAPL